MFPSRRAALGGDVFRDEYSLAFDGTDAFVNCGSGATLDNFCDGGGTFSAWIHPETGGEENEGRILDKRDDGTGIIFFLGDESGSTCKLKIFHDYSSTGGSYITTNRDITYNRWTHVAFTYDTSGAGSSYRPKVYVDGILVAMTYTTDSVGSYTTDAAEDFIIGNYKTDEIRTFDGNISDVACYSSILTASQIATIYNGREPYNHKEGVASGSLISWWRMGDGTLDTFPLIADQTNATLGSNLITGSWTASGNWSESEGTISTTSETSTMLQNILTDAEVYKISYTASITSGTFKVYAGGGSSGALISSSGSYVEYLKCSTNTYFYFDGVTSFTGSISDISVQLVNGNAGLMINMAADDFTGDTP